MITKILAWLNCVVSNKRYPPVMPDTDPLRFVNDAHNRLTSYRIELNESLPTHPELLDYYIGICVAEMIVVDQQEAQYAIDKMNEAKASIKALLDKQDYVGDGQI